VERRFAGTINLGTGVGVSVEHVARQLGALLGKPELIKPAADPVPDPFPFVVADVRKLKSIGWQQKVFCEEGLRRLVEGTEVGEFARVSTAQHSIFLQQ